eukprot:gene1020-609_t
MQYSIPYVRSQQRRDRTVDCRTASSRLPSGTTTKVLLCSRAVNTPPSTLTHFTLDMTTVRGCNSNEEKIVSVLAGGFAGICSTCVTNPLDTIRVRLSAGTAATGKKHKSLIHTTRDLFHGGLKHAFSRGLAANILASVPSNAVYLPSYRLLQIHTSSLGMDENIRPVICASGAVMVTNFTLSPLFLVRTRVQVSEHLTIRQVTRDVYRRDGVRGFYRGTLTNIAGRCVEEGTFWTVYELMKRLTSSGSFAEANFFWASAAVVSLSMLAKLTAVSVAYPYNVVMNHLRTVNKVTGAHDHVRVLPTVSHIYRHDGLLGFYKGLAPQLLRSVASKATQIYSFELVMHFYLQSKLRSSVGLGMSAVVLASRQPAEESLHYPAGFRAYGYSLTWLIPYLVAPLKYSINKKRSRHPLLVSARVPKEGRGVGVGVVALEDVRAYDLISLLYRPLGLEFVLFCFVLLCHFFYIEANYIASSSSSFFSLTHSLTLHPRAPVTAVGCRWCSSVPPHGIPRAKRRRMEKETATCSESAPFHTPSCICIVRYNMADRRGSNHKKSKGGDVDPRVLDALPLLRHATKLYNDYVRLAPPAGVHDIQLCRFGDYLKHFGFALEKELPHNTMDTTLKGSRRLPPLFVDTQEVIQEAGWGMPKPLILEADARSAEVDMSALRHDDIVPTLVEDVAKAVVAPFERISRTQSATQAALKKARALYTWLATNVAVTLEEPSPITQQAGNPRAAAGKAKPPPKPAKEKKRGSRDAKKGATPVAAAEEEVPPNPLVVALTTHLATPATMAELYASMLTHVSVPTRIVEGYIKGPSSEEALEWSWNIVCIDGKCYLVDIAYSSYNGPLRRAKPEAKPAEAVAKGRGAKATAAAKKETKKEEAPPPVAESSAAIIPPTLSLTTPPKLSVWRRKIEDFYFFTNPTAFIHTHLAKNESDSLLNDPPTRVAWDLSPRQTHNIFQFGVSLVSHRRNQCFTVRSAPFYITVKNENPSKIQLCCALFKCSLWELPEDLKDVSPLAPEWVWHQRRESDNTETFTITVPDGGFYSAVIGARHIREDPYTSHISSEAFTPLVEYQMKVNFVPIATPTFPRQHLSPNLCRLMYPLARNILAGSHEFAVMPSCSNVVAVALVRYTPPAADPGELDEAEDLLHGTREIIQFLQFNAEMVTYEGVAHLDPSTIVEVWVLYRAPDKNGFTFQEKVAIEEKEKVPTPPPSPVAQKSKKPVKRKVPTVDATASEEVEMSKLLAEVAAGRAFIPFVSGIQAKTLLTRETGGVIQPQPKIEEERAPVMRRLAGITPTLYSIATDLQQHQFRPVGEYYERRNGLLRMYSCLKRQSDRHTLGRSSEETEKKKIHLNEVSHHSAVGIRSLPRVRIGSVRVYTFSCGLHVIWFRLVHAVVHRILEIDV